MDWTQNHLSRTEVQCSVQYTHDYTVLCDITACKIMAAVWLAFGECVNDDGYEDNDRAHIYTKNNGACM